MKVRRNCIVWLILATLSSIVAGGCGQKGNNMSQRTQTEKPIQTEQQAGSASPAASGEKTEDQNEKDKKRKIKSVTVIDETGKNRKLRLGDLDEKNVASYFCVADPTGKFSQVDDGHFLYSFDLETQKEKEFFHYKRNKAYKCYGAASYDSVFLSIDDKYIYCQDFAIPRNGGKMQPLLRNAMQYDNGLIAFSSNSKYIYYLDQKYKMHRIDKKTKKDTQICKTEMLSVHCTEEKVYAKKYKDTLLPLYWDDDGDAEAQEVDDPSASILYCVDLDGKNVKRIWEGGW